MSLVLFKRNDNIFPLVLFKRNNIFPLVLFKRNDNIFPLFSLRETIIFPLVLFKRNYNIFPLDLFKRNNIFPLVPFPVGRPHLRIHSLLQSPLRVRLPLTTPPLTMGAWSLLLKIERSRMFLQIHRCQRPHLVATDFLMFFVYCF